MSRAPTDEEIEAVARRWNASPDFVRAMPRMFGLPDPLLDAIEGAVLRAATERLDREMLAPAQSPSRT